MIDKPTYNDAPITDPSADRFGVDPFAKALAVSIRKIGSPDGTVVALNGPWGSGKSSAVNLLLHHLKDAVDAGEISIINFACWWFRGEEALALAFFRELYAGLGPSLGDRFKQALPKIGARLLRAGGVVGAGIDLAGGAGAGTVASSAMNWLSGLIKEDDTVEKLHADLVTALSEQKKRFLIVIDDIDRLAPDEALLIFRLVKSVGRLPNVIYLLVFDRKLAEAIVSDRYPSEGPHYLEKIIQAGFDIPEPRQSELSGQLLEQIDTLCGTPAERDMVRFTNVFYDVVLPEIKTPRDLVRLMNVLAVTWPSVGSEIDQADFMALETLRVFRPDIQRTLRSAKAMLCGTGGMSITQSARNQAPEYERRLLGAVFVVALLGFLSADTFEVGRKGWKEKSKLLISTVAVTGSLALLGVYLALRVGLQGLTTLWLSLLLSMPLIAIVNVFSAISEWRKNRKISTVKAGLAIVFSSMLVVFLGKVAAENQALNSSQKFELVTESETLADVRIVRSSSAGLIVSKDGQIMFLPMGRIKSVKSNDHLEPTIYERSSP